MFTALLGIIKEFVFKKELQDAVVGLDVLIFLELLCQIGFHTSAYFFGFIDAELGNSIAFLQFFLEKLVKDGPQAVAHWLVEGGSLERWQLDEDVLHVVAFLCLVVILGGNASVEGIKYFQAEGELVEELFLVLHQLISRLIVRLTLAQVIHELLCEDRANLIDVKADSSRLALGKNRLNGSYDLREAVLPACLLNHLHQSSRLLSLILFDLSLCKWNNKSDILAHLENLSSHEAIDEFNQVATRVLQSSDVSVDHACFMVFDEVREESH